jgi:hypothetical protein
MTDPKPAVISYAPPPARRRGRRRVVWGVAVLLAAGAAFAVWKWGKPARAQFNYMMEQRAVMAMAQPADRVIYDDEPNRMAALLANPSEYECTDQRFGKRGPAAHYWSTQWLAFRPGRFYDGVAFAGGRTTKGGRERIAFITTDVIWGIGDGRLSALYANPYVPAQWKLGSLIVYPKHVTTVTFDLEKEHQLRIYAGQRDAADDSRVTFAYDINGKPGLIEARLVDVGPDTPAKIRASGDDTTIELRVLSGPGVELVKPER